VPVGCAGRSSAPRRRGSPRRVPGLLLSLA